MKKTPLARKTPLKAGNALTRKAPLRARSRKTAALYRGVRGPLVAQLLTDRPCCEIRWDDQCQGRAVDVDEIQGRGVGGSITDPANLQTTCRHCHGQKHDNPAEAKRRGLTRSAP